MITIIETKQKQISTETLFKRLQAKPKGLIELRTKDKTMKIFSILLRQYRFEVFKTFEGYKIICNGYNEIKRFELESNTILSFKVVIQRLKDVLEDKNISVSI